MVQLIRRFRRYLIVMAAFALAGIAGVAMATWLAVPTGTGSAYGKGDTAQGVALTSMDFSSGNGLGSAIGPNASGSLTFQLANSNTFGVNVTSVSVPAGSKITSIADSSCQADPSTFTVSGWSGSADIAGQANSSTQTMKITTTDAFPQCLAGHVFSLPITISGQPDSTS